MNKKGFTLTELVLVVILVAILSLLASTAVVKQITKSRREAAYRNAISYVSAINDYNFISEGQNLITTGNTSTISPLLKDSFEGTRPISGTVTIDSTTNKVSSADLYYKGYRVTYNGSGYTVVDN